MKTRMAAGLGTILLVVGAMAASGGEAPSPKFAKKPVARKADGKVRIDFAVDHLTDVAVFIEDGAGKIVRHLAAGVLGDKAPQPFKPGLSQSIEWDGKGDYGRPAGPGPFKVRVALGLGAKYDRVLFRDPQGLRNVNGLATGPDGTLYVAATFGAFLPIWQGHTILAFNRDGTYQRTVLPVPASRSREEMAALGMGTVELEGRPAPLYQDILTRRFFGEGLGRQAGTAVTPGGAIMVVLKRGQLGAIRPNGTAAGGPFVGPRFGGKAPFGGFQHTFMTVSPDGSWAYVSGLGAKVVHRVKLPERGPVKVFFGNAGQAGKDDVHLGGEARGLACDGKGNLLVADFANDRVLVISEKDGKRVAAMPVARPDGVAVHPASGAVYVLRLTNVGSGVMELVKFSGWKNAREVAKLSIGAGGNPSFPARMTLDATAKPPIVWVGKEDGRLLRIEDLGGKFGDARTVCSNKKRGLGSYVDVTVDHLRESPEVYTRLNHAWWLRYDEKADKVENLKLILAKSAGTCVVPTPNGHILAPAYPCHVLRFSRNGKPAAGPDWSGRYQAKGKYSKGPRHGMYLPVSMTYMTHTLGVRHDGRLFILEPEGPGGKPPKMLREYLPNGKRVSDTPVIWHMSDYAVGPKFDQAGNMYFAEIVRPLDDLYPKEFEKFTGKVDLAGAYGGSQQGHVILGMYGSIVKFTPKGGMIHYTDRHNAARLPYKRIGKPKLAAGLKKTKAIWYSYENEGGVSPRRWYPVEVTGAEWIRMGISHFEHAKCNCENVRFDVDEFGRVWYPDLARFRVGVLDTNGNRITHFGGYGNAESKGPDSPVVDPKTGKVRPRKPGEKLKSPFAEPEIAFSWLVGVGATDRYAYMGDSMNRRLLRAKLTYAAEETCAVK